MKTSSQAFKKSPKLIFILSIRGADFEKYVSSHTFTNVERIARNQEIAVQREEWD